MIFRENNIFYVLFTFLKISYIEYENKFPEHNDGKFFVWNKGKICDSFKVEDIYLQWDPCFQTVKKSLEWVKVCSGLRLVINIH